ncbi:gamma-glutamylcyclotransferase family protein [Clostridium sp.]|uniref:gamma-glutamylcyclotransferase family protein n=1 Tax=Clostridium sp. TaxID=1506 RepID=UPI0025C267D9|nr:gamma-glutamylcyclotransferase family protein [Clostridium sp.]
MKKINLFVYGSLREGFFNYDKYLSGKISKKMNAKLNNVELYHMPYKGYPAIINGQDSILGEIMVINEADYDSTLEAMDAMEGFLGEGNPENEYHKMIFEVENLESNEIESCYVYFYNKDKDELFDYKAVYLPNGDWKEHMLSNYLV